MRLVRHMQICNKAQKSENYYLVERDDPTNKYILISEANETIENNNYDTLSHLQLDDKYEPRKISVSIEELEKAHMNCIGEGFFGKVYRADILNKEKERQISVAIKCLKKNCGFAVHEFILLSLCRHKNILAPFKLIGRRILVTEYMPKGTIQQYIINQGSLIGQKEVLFWKWACDVSDGMNYLHTHYILHLDIHAGNILIRDDNTAVIGDFGQARGKMGHVDTPQWYHSQMLKWNFVIEVVQQERISSKIDVLFFGWMLSFFLQKDYVPNWEPPEVISTQQQLGLIKACLNRHCSNRPSFSFILNYCQTQYRAKVNIT